MMKGFFWRRIVLLSLFVALAAAGCTTPKTVTVEVVGENEFRVGHRHVHLDQLTEALASARAKAQTEIRVSLPPNAAKESLTPIIAALGASGYRKVIFSRPREAKASVKNQ